MHCAAAAQLEQTEYDPTDLYRSLPECCFLEAWLVSLSLPLDFNWIGPAACERCLQLQSVDLSRTQVTEILGSTFAHCLHLQLSPVSCEELNKKPSPSVLHWKRSVSHLPCCTLHDEPLRAVRGFAFSTKLAKARLGEEPMLGPMPLRIVNSWTHQNGFASSRQVPRTDGWMNSILKCVGVLKC